ncbi:MAG: SUMF1/EgtB/PvdO family nonheme iron enzyme [Phycisphaerae bacterium]|nr:SUMF1/EgtB/PvdO family nonheme iron enzyme [Phycisphaerae bacterium]
MASSGVFIGVNDPRDYGELGSLLYAEADAEAMARLMEDRCGVKPDVLTGSRATRTNIEKAVRSAGRGDLFVFICAGHDRHLGDHYYLYLCDTDASSYGMLSLGDLSRLWRRNFEYDHVLAILDACRSEGVRGGGLDDPSLRDIKAVCQGTRRVEVIYGCGLDQVGHEFQELGCGLLTHSLLTYLWEHCGSLSAFDWADNTADLMSQWCTQNKRAIRQSPWWDGPLGRTERLVVSSGTTGVGEPPLHIDRVPPCARKETTVDLSRSAERRTQVLCPLCGVQNGIEETRTCQICKLDHLCQDHLVEGWQCCYKCATTPAGRKQQNQSSQAAFNRPGLPTKDPKIEIIEAPFPMTPEQAQEVQRAAAEALGVPLKKSMCLSWGVTMEMIFIPPGESLMGSPNKEKGRGINEGPQRRVKRIKGFYMGIYEATQAQWEAAMQNRPSHFKGGDRPVETVSWDDAVAFCRKSGKRAGVKRRLPKIELAD